MLSTYLTLVLVASPWPQKEWFTDLFPLQVAEPLVLPLLWNLFVQLPVRTFHALESLIRQSWKLRSNSSIKLVFWRRLQRLLLYNRRRSCSISLPGEVVKIPPLVSWGEYICLWSYCSTDNRVLVSVEGAKTVCSSWWGLLNCPSSCFSLAGVDLMASRISSWMFISFKKTSTERG